jgi:hypothetical protein
MYRTQPQASEHRQTVPTCWPSAEQLVLRAARGVGRELDADAGDRPPVHQAAILRHPKGSETLRDQPQAGPAAHATAGARGGVSQAIDQPPGPWPQGLPVFTAEYSDYEARSGLGKRHHLHPSAAWIPLSDGSHGSLQPQRPVLAALQHAYGRLLPRSPGRSVVASTAGDLQHRSRSPVHGDGLHEPIEEARRSHLDGRSRPRPRQRFRRTTVANGQVRGGLPTGLRRRLAGQEVAGEVLQILPERAAPSGPRLPHSIGGLC